MPRSLRAPVLFALLLAVVLVAPAALCPATSIADEAAPPPPPPPGGQAEDAAPAPLRIVDDETAAAALERFKEDYKARGLKGEDKLFQRDYAMSELARVQHPDVVAALAKIAKGSNATLRTLAVIYLGEQRALPGLAGPPILKAMKRGSKDTMLINNGLQSLGNLRYLGAVDQIGKLLGHRDFAVKKAAIQCVGQIKEMRLWKEIFKMAGVTVRTGEDVDAGTDQQGGSKEEVVEEGYSYEGAEERVDWGLADNTAENAEAKRRVEAKIAANKRAAQAKSGRSGGGGGGSGVGGGATGRGGVARDPSELTPFVLKTLFDLTGERFSNSKQVAKWVRANRQLIRDTVKQLNLEEKDQVEDAKELR